MTIHVALAGGAGKVLRGPGRLDLQGYSSRSGEKLAGLHTPQASQPTDKPGNLRKASRDSLAISPFCGLRSFDFQCRGASQMDILFPQYLN